MVRWLLVGLGGALGAMARFGLAGAVQLAFPKASFPFGTMVVNLLGCLAIGVVMGLSDARQAFTAEVRAFLVPGILGGFTTFSAFGYETLALARDGDHARALANVAVSVIAGLACVWVGYTGATWR